MVCLDLVSLASDTIQIHTKGSNLIYFNVTTTVRVGLTILKEYMNTLTT